MATETEQSDRVNRMLDIVADYNEELREFIDWARAQDAMDKITDGFEALALQPLIIIPDIPTGVVGPAAPLEAVPEVPAVEITPPPAPVSRPADLDILLNAIRQKIWIEDRISSPYPCSKCGKTGTIGQMCTITVMQSIPFKDLKGVTLCRDCASGQTKRPGIRICTKGSDIHPLVNTIKTRVNPMTAFPGQL